MSKQFGIRNKRKLVDATLAVKGRTRAVTQNSATLYVNRFHQNF